MVSGGVFCTGGSVRMIGCGCGVTGSVGTGCAGVGFVDGAIFSSFITKHYTRLL
jgi:hypothetical protein